MFVQSLKNLPLYHQIIEKDIQIVHMLLKMMLNGISRNILKDFLLLNRITLREYAKRKFLEGELSISKMNKLYLEWVQEKSDDSKVVNATFRQYSEIFNNEYNYAFFKPKKGMCDVCKRYRLANPEEKKVYKLHMMYTQIILRY